MKDESIEFSEIRKTFKLLLATRDATMVGAKWKILIFEVSESLENAL